MNIIVHCVKRVCIRSCSGPHFSAFGLNTERYGVSLNSVRMRENVDLITPNTDNFHAVVHLLFRCSVQIYIISLTSDFWVEEWILLISKGASRNREAPFTVVI